MLKKSSFIIVLTIFIVTGCNKETESNAIPSSNSLNINAMPLVGKDTLGTWFGTFYLSDNGDPDQPPDTISESVLIKNGLASVPFNKSNITTSIGYYLPSDQNLAGDSIAFEAAVKDDSDFVLLDVMGTQSTASVKYVKGPNNTGTITLGVGNIIQSAQVNAIDFTSYKSLSIILKENRAYCYISKKLLLSLNYTGGTRIGRIKTLSIGSNEYSVFNFFPYNFNSACDYVKIYNSYSKRILMREDFNIDGRSNTIFY